MPNKLLFLIGLLSLQIAATTKAATLSTGDLGLNVITAAGAYEWSPTLSSLTNDLPATLTVSYGLWNDPEVTVHASVNGTEVGSFLANNPFFDGAATATFSFTNLLVDGANTIRLDGLGVSEGEYVISQIDLTYNIPLPPTVVTNPPATNAPPTVVSAVFANGNTEILVTYSEPMFVPTAEEQSNYILFYSNGEFQDAYIIVSQEDEAGTQFRMHLDIAAASGSYMWIYNAYDLAFQITDPTPAVVPIQDGADTTPPTVSASVSAPMVTANKQQLVNVGLTVMASDNVTANPTISITVLSDETLFPGDFTYANGVLSVRAERNGAGDGRVYLIIVTATDEANNSTSTCTTVAVPHSNSAEAIASVQAQAAAAAANCGF